jgi:hypothetical protein
MGFMISVKLRRMTGTLHKRRPSLLLVVLMIV